MTPRREMSELGCLVFVVGVCAAFMAVMWVLIQLGDFGGFILLLLIAWAIVVGAQG